MKRFVFLVGFTTLLFGVLVLMGAVEMDDDFNCGSALAPRRILIPDRAEECRERVETARRLGVVIVAVAAPAVLATGPRSLLAPD